MSADFNFEDEYIRFNALINKKGLPLHEDLKQLLSTGKYSGNNKDDALVLLLTLIMSFYKKTMAMFSARSSSQIIEFAALSRLQLECYAAICWILEEPSQSKNRASRFMDSGYDLHKHTHNVENYHSGLRAKRTRSRLPTTESLLKYADNGRYISWYDELNYFLHPSPAVFTRYATEGLPKTMFLSPFLINGIFGETVLVLVDKTERLKISKKTSLLAKDLLNSL